MDKQVRKRPVFIRRHYQRGDGPLPERAYRAKAITRDRDTWFCDYDVVGKRAIGSMYDGPEMVRRVFNVKLEAGKFRVDVGTGSGVTIEFKHIPRSQ